MQYLRLIDPRWWSERDGCFNDMAFKPSSAARGGGISVVETHCACRETGTACAHLEKFYGPKFAPPILVWKFDGDVFPGHKITNEPGPNGCPCHRNVREVSKGKARKHFEDDYDANGWQNFSICGENEGVNGITEEDVRLWTLRWSLSQDTPGEGEADWSV